MRMLGPGEVAPAQLKDLLKVCTGSSLSQLLETSLFPSFTLFLNLAPLHFTDAYVLYCPQVGEQYAREMSAALNTKLKEEDVRRNQKARERFELHR